MLQLSNMALLPLDYAATGQEIVALLDDLAGKVGGEFDLEPAAREAARFTELANRCRATRGGAAADPARRRRFNELVMRLGRVLNPAIYSVSGRFHHDPAEWTPLLRPQSESRLGGLAKAAALPQLSGRAEQGFLRAQVTRERNRIVTALREASALIEESRILDGQM